MAADSSNDLELALKKRARRRLVGAIGLVLLMVIVLPMVLQDRAALAPQESIQITMPDDVVSQQSPKNEANIAPVESLAELDAPSESAMSEQVTSEPSVAAQIDKPVQPEKTKAVSEVKKEMQDEKKAEVKKTEIKEPEAKPSATSSESFTIQVGVFSDIANVKQLQARLKEVGLDSRTENITTPKGEKIRLRAGRFSSRQEAAYALTKLQAADLTGMVISNN